MFIHLYDNQLRELLYALDAMSERYEDNNTPNSERRLLTSKFIEDFLHSWGDYHPEETIKLLTTIRDVINLTLPEE